MFKTLDADCRRLPNRIGLTTAEPEPVVVEVTPEVIEEPEVVIQEIVEEIVEPAPKPKPKKKRKSKRPVVVETVVSTPETPTPEFYDYPFVEKIEEVVEEVLQEVEFTPTPLIETPYEWTTPELSHDRRSEVAPTTDTTLAYILDAEREAPPEEGFYYDRVYRDHLEPRRA